MFKKSIRLRLLTMALLPLLVLMPLVLGLGMARWSSAYDQVLVQNVQSDLKIAEQYLRQILSATNTNVKSIAQSTAFAQKLDDNPRLQHQFLRTEQDKLGLDFLYFLPQNQAQSAAIKWPVIARALNGDAAVEIDLFANADLAALSKPLAQRAHIELMDTKAAVPTTRKVEDRAMVVHTASKVSLPHHKGVLVGGILLNKNLEFIDTINALVYLNAQTGGTRQGTATLFLEDVRVSTNVRLFEDVRALGTRVSAAVRRAVLDEGKIWLDRAFVVNDWYISGYLPLKDSFGKPVGMLYVGFLEAPFNSIKRVTYVMIIAIFALVCAITAPIFLRIAKGVFSPLERINQTIKHVEDGDLHARNGMQNAEDEITQVAVHLDSLLDQIQERDQDLRSWADELNTRVEQRTQELKEANIQLESTFQQLVTSEKLAAIGEITAGVAHEINNPVAVIQGNLDVIRQTLASDTEQVATELDLIDRQIYRIDTIVGKLLQFARPNEFGTFAEDVDLTLVIDDCLVLVDHVLSKRSITVTKQIENIPDIHVSPGEIQQVLVNLIVNAAQAIGENGEIELTLKSAYRGKKPGVKLTVLDTGIGIDPADIKKVFDPFHTSKHGEGTGLGLSISQRLVQQAGGVITAKNRAKGKRNLTGAAFSVWLPLPAQQL